ncbi:hypothetical protein HanRHA438_Chr11g0516821 [Helianthus annuus]|nr:hypothetical protein HanRHA438_Chr11g0516821 [Helianthus annuus]
MSVNGYDPVISMSSCCQAVVGYTFIKTYCPILNYPRNIYLSFY